MKTKTIMLMIIAWIITSCVKETQSLQLSATKVEMMFASNMRTDADGEPTIGTRIRISDGEMYHETMGVEYYTVGQQYPESKDWNEIHSWFTGFLQKQKIAPFEKSKFSPSLQAISMSILSDYILPAPASNERGKVLQYYWNLLDAQDAIETEVLAATLVAMNNTVSQEVYVQRKTNLEQQIASDIEKAERSLSRLRARSDKAASLQTNESVKYMYEITENYSIIKKSRKAAAILNGL